MVRCTVDAVEQRRYSDVDRKQIVGERWPPLDFDASRRPIDARNRTVDQACACPIGETHGVDMALRVAVVARDEARQHPRIGRLDLARDDGHDHAWLRLHAE